MLYVVPDTVGDEETVGKADFLSVVEIGGCSEQTYYLLPPAVGNIERSVGDVAIIVPAVVRCDVLLEGVDDIKDDGGNTDIGYGGLYLGVFLVSDGKVVIYLRFVLVGVGYHALELFPTIDARDIQAYDESVPKGFESLVGGRKLVGGCDESLQGDLHGELSVAIDLLVDNGEKRVLYGWTGLPYLVEENDVGRGEVALGHALVGVQVLELGDGDRAKDFVGGAEARHKILEVGGILECQLQSSCHHTLGNTRRTQQEDALAGYCREEREGDGVLLLVNMMADLFK